MTFKFINDMAVVNAITALAQPEKRELGLHKLGDARSQWNVIGPTISPIAVHSPKDEVQT